MRIEDGIELGKRIAWTDEIFFFAFFFPKSLEMKGKEIFLWQKKRFRLEKTLVFYLKVMKTCLC